jgi:hypothetical protein
MNLRIHRDLIVMVTLLASVANAQDRPPPEVMFLIDNSASMRRAPTSPRADGLPECIENFEYRERLVNGVTERRITAIEGATIMMTHLSGMQMIRNVLGGNSINNSADPN